MIKSYLGTNVEALPEESTLKLDLPFRYIDISDINIQLLNAAFYDASDLRGFNNPRLRTNPRIVKHYEVVFFPYSNGKCVINNKMYNISAGDIRFHKPGDIVYSYKYSDIYVIHFSLSPAGNEITVNDTLNGIAPFMNSFDANTIHSIFEEIIKAKLNNDKVLIKLHLWELVRQLIRNSDELRRTRKYNSQNDVIATAKKYMKENYAEKLSIEDISNHVFLHPNYFHRLFVKNTQKTPLEYLTNIRLMRACELLLTTNLSIQEISEQCGFCNSSYLIRVFKKKYSTTPNGFRIENTPPTDDIM